MTLIAGFKAYRTPVLLSDFVLSISGQRTGLRKKVCRLASNCVLAWTGHVIAAEHVFRQLRERFAGLPIVTKDSLEQALTEFNESDFGIFNVVIIGWVVETEQYCLRWRSDWPHEVFYDQAAYGGSGYKIVERWCGQGITEKANPNLIDVSLTIDECLAITANLMSMEILESDVSNLTFGHAYEILYFDGIEFNYVTDILYLAATISFDQDMTI